MLSPYCSILDSTSFILGSSILQSISDTGFLSHYLDLHLHLSPFSLDSITFYVACIYFIHFCFSLQNVPHKNNDKRIWDS